MKSGNYSQCEVPQKEVIFILSGTVVCVKMCVCLSETMVCEMMVNVAGRQVGAFPNTCGFINQIVDLSRDGLADHSKNSTFTRHGHNQRSNVLSA